MRNTRKTLISWGHGLNWSCLHTTRLDKTFQSCIIIGPTPIHFGYHRIDGNVEIMGIWEELMENGLKRRVSLRDTVKSSWLSHSRRYEYLLIHYYHSTDTNRLTIQSDWVWCKYSGYLRSIGGEWIYFMEVTTEQRIQYEYLMIVCTIRRLKSSLLQIQWHHCNPHRISYRLMYETGSILG